MSVISPAKDLTPKKNLEGGIGVISSIALLETATNRTFRRVLKQPAAAPPSRQTAQAGAGGPKRVKADTPHEILNKTHKLVTCDTLAVGERVTRKDETVPWVCVGLEDTLGRGGHRWKLVPWTPQDGLPTECLLRIWLYKQEPQRQQ